MKRGCFFTGIIILTITVGVGFYLYKKYFPEIKNYGKEKIIEISLNEINKKINDVSESDYKDSLKVLLSKYSEIIKENDLEEATNNFGNLIDQVEIFIKDNSIDSVEFTALKNMVIIK